MHGATMKKIQDKNLTIARVLLYEEQCILVTLSRSFLLIMRKVSHKSCTENPNTHFVFSNFFFC